MKEAFLSRTSARGFSQSSREMIEQARAIGDEYEAAGLWPMTIRQMHYQFVARGLYANEYNNYQKLVKKMTQGRLYGEIDWAMLEDRNRDLETLTTWDSPADIIDACVSQYRIDPWATQKYRPEVWVEKDAVSGVIRKPCNELRVPFMACKGFATTSPVYETGKRLAEYIKGGQTPVVIYIGDHDGAGFAMLDGKEGLRVRIPRIARAPIDIRRIALTREQIEAGRLPPNRTKSAAEMAKDRNKPRYDREHAWAKGDYWELDALEPAAMMELIRKSVSPLIDKRKWKAALGVEAFGRDRLQQIADQEAA